MSIENNSTIEQSRNMPKGDAQSIPKGWVETTLGGVADIFNQKRVPLSAKVRDTRRGVYPYYGASNIVDYIDDYIFNGEYLLISEDGENLNTRNTPIAFIAKGKFWVNNHAHILKGKQPHLTKYLELYFSKLDISAFITGAVQPKLSKGNLINIPITIPKSTEEQKAIAQILTAFDDKIELLQDQNKTLETTAQTIFKEWFGKYQIGDELPEGWRVGRLGEEFNITIGRTPPRKEKEWFSNTPIGKKWISIKDIGNSGAYISNTAEYLTNKAIERFNIPIIPKNTTILSFKMTVGKLTITTEDMLSNEAIAHLKLKQNTVLSSEFIYLYLQDLDFNALGSTSSIVTAINSTMIKYLEFLMPEKNILLQFDELIKPIFDKIYNNTTQIQTLKQTRDTLLPKLMSGQLRVDEFKGIEL